MFVLVRYLFELGIDYITDKKAQSSENASQKPGQPSYKPRPCSPLANSQFRHHVRAHMQIPTRSTPANRLQFHLHLVWHPPNDLARHFFRG